MHYLLTLLYLFLAGSVFPQSPDPFLIVLGTMQDAGAPHVACQKSCCADLFKNPDPDLMVVSLGLVDPASKTTWLFEATPDLPRQVKMLNDSAGFDHGETPNGIFITHAHIGHYTGLMYLGRESMNADAVPVFAMPRMKSFLENNGPWDQLVKLGNISLISQTHERPNVLAAQLRVTPFLVPHRDEYSETVGYRIEGPNKTALFIPDIDKWEKWDRDIVEEIKAVDYAFIDGTFYDGEEIGHRDISEIPHPFMIESMELFKDLPEIEKGKVYFIHFNHTNVEALSRHPPFAEGFRSLRAAPRI